MHTVLLIDDDESNRLTLSALLELEGLDVETLATSADARARFESPPQPDLVILDQHLGDGVGTDLLAPLRAKFPAAKVLLMSGSLPRGATIPGHVDACFAKGESLADLLARVMDLLARRDP